MLVLALLLGASVSCASAGATARAASFDPVDVASPRAAHAAARKSSARRKRRSADGGAYVTGRLGSSWLSGDFEFEEELFGPDQLLLPHVGTGFLRELTIGARSDEGFAAEVAFIRESYDGHYGSRDSDLELSSVALRCAQHYSALDGLRMYAIAGVLYSWGTIENSSRTWSAADAGLLNYSDTHLSQGWGAEAGGGFAIPLTRELELDLRCTWLERSIFSATGAAGHSEGIGGGLAAHALQLTVGLTFGF